MKEIKNIYGMPKKSWKRFCDSKNTIKQRRENKEARKPGRIVLRKTIHNIDICKRFRRA